MAQTVELDTIQATKQLQNMQVALQHVANAASIMAKQINMLAKVTNQLASQQARLAAQQSKVSNAQRVASASATRQAAALLRQKKAAASAENQFKALQQRLIMLGGTRVQIDSLGRSFQAFQTKMKSGVLTANQFADSQIRWTRAQATIRRELQRTGFAKATKEASDLNTQMKNIGSAAVFAVGPLSGVGARLVAFEAIAARTNLKIALLAAGIAGLVVVAGLLIKSTLSAGLALDKLEGTFRAGTGSAGAARQAFDFASKVAHELGLNLQSAAGQFAKLNAAAKGTTLEGEGVKNIFEAVSRASVALRLSTEQTEGAFRAIEQMISKGTVQAEELRGQLGERLPGAFQIAARAMGVTTRQLGKMLEGGEVLAEDLLPKLAKELDSAFSGEALIASQKLSAQIERLKTNFFELLVVVERWLDTVGIGSDILRNLNQNLERFTTENLVEEFERLRENVMQARDAVTDALEELERRRALGLDTSIAAQELQNAFVDARMAEGEFFSLVEEHSRELASAGIEIKIRPKFLFNPEQIKGGPATLGAMPTVEMGPLIPEINFPKDTVKKVQELREEFRSIGGSKTQGELKELDKRLEEITEGLRKMEKPAEFTARQFSEFKAGQVAEAARMTEGLKNEVLALAAAERQSVLTTETDAQRVIQLKLAGQDDLAKMLEIELETRRELTGESEAFVSQVIAARQETEKMTGDLEAQVEFAKRLEGIIAKIKKDQERAAAAREKEAEKLKDYIRDLQQSNNVLMLRIKGEKELADELEASYEIQNKFPDLTKEQLKAVHELLVAHKELSGVLEEQTESQKAFKEAAQDFAQVISKSFEDAIINGEKFSDILQALLEDIERIIIRLLVTKPLENALTAAFTGQGGSGNNFGFLGALIGSAFAPTAGPGPGPLPSMSGSFRQGGGFISPGVVTKVHEDETIIPMVPSRVIPADRSKEGSTMSMTGPTVFIDARGSDAAGFARLEQTIRELNGTIERRAVSAVVSERRRKPGLFGA